MSHLNLRRGAVLAVAAVGLSAYACAEDATRPLTPDEMHGIRLFERHFAPPEGPAKPARVGGLLENFTGLELSSVTIEIRIDTDRVGTHLQKFVARRFSDRLTGFSGTSLPGTRASFVLPLALQPSLSGTPKGYGLTVTGAQGYEKPADHRDPGHLFAEILQRGGATVETWLEADPALATVTDPVSKLTPLHFAAAKGDVRLMKALVSRGANLSAGSYEGIQPIHVASTSNATTGIQYLLDLGVKLDAPASNGSTPLHFAAEGGAPDATLMLQKAGADLDRSNEDGERAISIAIWRAKLPMLGLLLHLGASPNFFTKDSLSPLHLAVTMDDVEKIDLLVKAGLDVNLTGPDPIWTPLHCAAKAGASRAALRLLQLGADRGIKTKNGNTAADLAMKYGHEELAQILR